MNRWQFRFSAPPQGAKAVRQIKGRAAGDDGAGGSFSRGGWPRASSRRAIVAMAEHQAAIPTLAVSDTVKQIDSAGRVAATLDRSSLVTVQTPQAFAFADLLAAHRRAAAANRHDFTDDAALAEWA